MSTQGIGPYTVYQSAVDQNCWLVRFGTIGPVYEYSTPMQAGSACDALNSAYLAGKQEHTDTAWISVEAIMEVVDPFLAGRYSGYTSRIRPMLRKRLSKLLPAPPQTHDHNS